jgi:hypothetical protein
LVCQTCLYGWVAMVRVALGARVIWPEISVPGHRF